MSNGRLSEDAILIDKISRYEAAEKKGLLVWLPVPLGTTIYTVIYAPEVNAGYISENKMTLKYYADNIKLFNAGCVHTEPTKAEAMLTELKMQRMRCDDEDL